MPARELGLDQQLRLKAMTSYIVLVTTPAEIVQKRKGPFHLNAQLRIQTSKSFIFSSQQHNPHVFASYRSLCDPKVAI